MELGTTIPKEINIQVFTDKLMIMKEENENKKGHWITDLVTIGVIIYGIYWAVKAFML